MRCDHCGDSLSTLRDCRECGYLVCDDCRDPDSLEVTERDRKGAEGEPARVVREETVICASCAEST